MSYGRPTDKEQGGTLHLYLLLQFVYIRRLPTVYSILVPTTYQSGWPLLGFAVIRVGPRAILYTELS